MKNWMHSKTVCIILVIAMLLLGGSFGLIAIFFTILFLRGVCRNQYRLRPLQYIHRKDGKKQNS